MIESGRFDRERLAEALEEVTLAQSRYRTYVTGADTVAQDDVASIRDAVATATRRRPDRFAEIDFVGRLLLGDTAGAEDGTARLQFVSSWQQLTTSSPRAPKTLPSSAITPCSLSTKWATAPALASSPRQRDLEGLLTSTRASLNASTTHDTKRSEEDARARLLVLSGFADEFRNLAARWHEITAPYRGEGDTAPSRKEEWYLYQWMIAAWPVEISDAIYSAGTKAPVTEAFRPRRPPAPRPTAYRKTTRSRRASPTHPGPHDESHARSESRHHLGRP